MDAKAYAWFVLSLALMVLGLVLLVFAGVLS